MMPKYIQEVVKNNIQLIPAPYAYRLFVNKHIPSHSIRTKLEKLIKWANKLFPCSVEIAVEERILGLNRAIDLIIYDPASKEIDKLIKSLELKRIMI